MIRTETRDGATLTGRPELGVILDFIHPGETLVVTRIDHVPDQIVVDLLARPIGPPCNDCHSRKIGHGASPPGPPGKGVGIHGISVRATRKPK